MTKSPLYCGHLGTGAANVELLPKGFRSGIDDLLFEETMTGIGLPGYILEDEVLFDGETGDDPFDITLLRNIPHALPDDIGR